MAQAKKSFCVVTELDRNYETNAYREDRHQSFPSCLGTLPTIQIRWALSIMSLVLRTGTVRDMLPRHETSDLDKAKLGGIECKLYISAFKVVVKCKVTNAVLQLNPNASGYKAYICANGSSK